MTTPIRFPHEDLSNANREVLDRLEPVALRTFTPSKALFSKSYGVFHETPEGRRLYDFSSGVLVANLGHNPVRWMRRFGELMRWQPDFFGPSSKPDEGYHAAVTLTAYNAATPLESQATSRLVDSLRTTSLGNRLQQVMWAASGSEAVQKALWACLHFHPERNIILATRHGFHGKKGLAGAVTGSEESPDRDPRVRFIGFPRAEIDDVSRMQQTLDLTPFSQELDAIARELGPQINCLITEPYLGGGGSYHPPAEYLQLLVNWCRKHDVLFILDEVQSNFGRTGRMYAFEKYGIEPDFVCLGKGLGNGVPVSAAAGRADVMASLKYGEASDTWSANPISCAAVIATLDEFERTKIVDNISSRTEQFVAGLNRLKETGLVAKVRGEGMVFGIECAAVGKKASQEVAIEIVRACYLGDGHHGIHLLGPLAGNVIRISPPLTITEAEATDSLDLLYRLIAGLASSMSVARH
ncbi:MAG: aspartate aminotransferase family protein [Planctomycetaceae bacterium]